MTRMQPEIVYQSFCRPTKLTETSPRYSRPPMSPRRDIMPPLRWSAASARRRVRAGRALRRRHRGAPRGPAPSRAGSRPDHLWPWPKNRVRASRVTIGLVNRNTTTTSMSVVRPSVYAKPFTSPTEKMYSSRAARKDTVSDDQDRPPGPFPAALHRAAQRAALAYLVAQSFEEHHERVGGDADGHDEARDAGQRQREALVLAEQHDGQVADQRRDQPGWRPTRCPGRGSRGTSRGPPAAGRSPRR